MNVALQVRFRQESGPVTKPVGQAGYFFGEFFFAERRTVLAVLFFATTGLAPFALGAFLTLLFLVAIAGLFAAGVAVAFFEVSATLATGFFADLAARFGFFAITASETGPA